MWGGTRFCGTAAVTLHQGWQVVAKSGFNHWFLPAKTDWQKMGWQKVSKNKINLIIKIFLILVYDQC